jgi:HlyD family secretion protein
MIKKVLLVLLLVVLVGGGLYVYNGYRQAQQARAEMTNFETAPLVSGSLATSISAIGKVRSSQSASLAWQTSGAVEQVHFKEGSLVKAGDVLATLQQTSLPQSVILAEADLASSHQAEEDLITQAETAKVQAMQQIVTYEQAVKDAQYNLDNFNVPTGQKELDTVEALNLMKERLDQARLDFEPYRYADADNPTREELKETLDEAQSDYNAAVKRLQLEYDLEVAEANLAKAQRDYEKWKAGPQPADVKAVQAKIAAAEATLRQAWVEAPFAGVITQALPQAGDQVAPGTEAFRIDNLDTLYIDLDISEIDIPQVQIGQGARITFDALRNKEYQGEVVEVAMINTPTDQVVNFTVTVSLTDPDVQVRPGMTAEVEIETEVKDNVLLIPNQAIQAQDGKQVVYVMDEAGSMVPVEVNLGLASDTNTELVSGDLKEGDLIVLNPTGAAEDALRRMMLEGPQQGGPGERQQSPFGDATPGGQP